MKNEEKIIKQLNRYADMAKHSFVREALNAIYKNVAKSVAINCSATKAGRITKTINDLYDTDNCHVLNFSISNIDQEIRQMMIEQIESRHLDFLMMNTYFLYGFNYLRHKDYKYVTLIYGSKIPKPKKSLKYFYKSSDGEFTGYTRPANAKDVIRITNNIKKQLNRKDV